MAPGHGRAGGGAVRRRQSRCSVAPAALAKTYSDVPKAYWDRADIAWVTNQGPTSAKALNDFSGGVFRPGQAITREQFARALVVLGGLQNTQVTPISVPDLPASDPYARYVQIALHLHLLAQYKDGFHPTEAMQSWQVDSGAVHLRAPARSPGRLDDAGAR